MLQWILKLTFQKFPEFNFSEEPFTIDTLISLVANQLSMIFNHHHKKKINVPNYQ